MWTPCKDTSTPAPVQHGEKIYQSLIETEIREKIWQNKQISSGENIIRGHLDVNVTTVAGLQVKVRNLWTQPSLHLLVHLIACLHEFHCQVHVVPREAVVGAQR